MKVKMLGPIAGVGPDGSITSWGPDQVVDVDDDDKAAVAFYTARVTDGVATLIDELADAKAVVAAAEKADAAEAKAEAAEAKADAKAEAAEAKEAAKATRLLREVG